MSKTAPMPIAVMSAILILATGLMGPVIQAAPVEIPALLPEPATEGVAFWDADTGKAFIVGGYSPTITAYDPIALVGTTVLTDTRLGAGDCGAWDPDTRTAYIAADPSQTILLFRPDDLALTTAVPVTNYHHNCAAVWDASRGQMHVFGGSTPGNNGADNIWTYDPTSGTVTDRGATLGGMRWAMAAAYDPISTHVFLFGGRIDGTTFTDEIVEYDPSADTLAVVGHLPAPLGTAAAVRIGASFYILGGYTSSSTPSDDIIRFTPSTGAVELLSEVLPLAVAGMASAGRDNTLWLFGGGYPGATTDVNRRIVEYGFNTGPLAAIAAIAPAECVAGSASIALDGSGSSDPENDPLSFAWSAPGIVFSPADAAIASATFPLGSTEVRLDVSDGALSNSTWRNAIVIDSQPPTLRVAPDREPPAHGWYIRNVTMSLAGEDACGDAVTLRSSIDGLAPVDGPARSIDTHGAHSFWSRSIDARGIESELDMRTIRVATLLLVSVDVEKPANPADGVRDGVPLVVCASFDQDAPAPGASLTVTLTARRALGIVQRETFEATTGADGCATIVPTGFFRLPGSYEVQAEAVLSGLVGEDEGSFNLP